MATDYRLRRYTILASHKLLIKLHKLGLTCLFAEKVSNISQRVFTDGELRHSDAQFSVLLQVVVSSQLSPDFEHVTGTYAMLAHTAPLVRGQVDQFPAYFTSTGFVDFIWPNYTGAINL